MKMQVAEMADGMRATRAIGSRDLDSLVPMQRRGSRQRGPLRERSLVSLYLKDTLLDDVAGGANALGCPRCGTCVAARA